MELPEIKRRLSIVEVLRYYGLEPDRNNRLHCPFHPDKTPSLQIYPATNTFCCFSSHCNVGTGDAIQFIQLKENCTKHEALVRATALVGGHAMAASIAVPIAAPQSGIEASGVEKIAVLTKVFSFYQSGLAGSERALEYLGGRKLNYRLLELAFNSGTIHGREERRHLTESLVKYGLLKPLPAKGYRVWAKDCILFPLKNADNKIVSLYGRSITDDQGNRHFYLAGREGLYPGYPKAATTKLILTESIIDAATLLEQNEIKSKYEILSLYGTNGLTDEHIKAIQCLAQLEEIILMLNADAAGEAASGKHYSTLKQLLPEVKISKTELPEGEDVNSILCTHDDPGVLADMIEQRRDFFLSIEKENKNPGTIGNPALRPSPQLDTRNAELLIYDARELYFEILGGIRITGLDRLKVTLKVKHPEKIHHPQWYSIDLYNQAQREQTINNIAETVDLPTQATTQTFIDLIEQLEHYRLQKIEAMQPKEKIKNELSPPQRAAAIAELKKPNLLQRTGQLLGQCGIVGEQNNSLIAYLVYTVRKQPVPLHVMFLGSSGSGKTYLQEKISELIPEEDKLEITQMTDNALYYFKQHELQHKLILIEDLDGAMTVFYPLRELQTKRRISKTVTLKDSRGNLKTITLTVEGPVCVSGCTTKEKIYEDNANRCILLYTDQTTEQDKRINAYQAKLSAGEINRERESQYRELFKNMQRVLRPIAVINPYAKYIELPVEVFKPRRTMTLLLGFIEAIGFYHQYQREVKKDSEGQCYIETTPEDIEGAFALLKDVLFSKSDELTRAARSFLEQLKGLCAACGHHTFNAGAIREQLRMNPGNMKRYLSELVRYGYIKPHGNRYRKGSYEYRIVNIAEYEALKSSVGHHLEAILETIQNLPAK